MVSRIFCSYKSTNLMNSILFITYELCEFIQKSDANESTSFLIINAELRIGETNAGEWFTSHKENVLLIFALSFGLQLSGSSWRPVSP